jgi:Protein of unknown function (DUF3175)
VVPLGGTNREEPIGVSDRNPAGASKAGARKTSTLKTATLKTAGKTAAKTTGKAHSARRQSIAKKAIGKSSAKRLSLRVTQESDALDSKPGVFMLTDPRRIAASLKRSAEHSSRRKTSAYRSGLSMLTFYINRAGKTLPKMQRDRLQCAKTELRHQFHRER